MNPAISTFPIQLQEISFTYKDAAVLANVSIRFSEKSVTALVGKSGSGKSTLLNLINGMLKPEKGEIILFDQKIDYDDIYSIRRKLGYVVQQGGLFPHLTIYKNISLTAAIHQLAANEIQGRVEKLMSIVELPLSYLTKYPYELSGGEQQRVSLCRALFLQPPVLLMDEPFASLDTVTKDNLYSYFHQVQKEEPRTVVLVTHDWEEARTLADYFVWLDKGSIRASGEIKDMITIEEEYRRSL